MGGDEERLRLGRIPSDEDAAPDRCVDVRSWDVKSSRPAEEQARAAARAVSSSTGASLSPRQKCSSHGPWIIHRRQGLGTEHMGPQVLMACSEHAFSHMPVSSPRPHPGYATSEPVLQRPV